MLKQLDVQNFKCFQQQCLQFRPLTLLTGVNSAGKSSVIQALLLLQQHVAANGKKLKLQLSGDLINLGLPEDVLYSNAEEDAFSITRTQADGSSCSLQGDINGTAHLQMTEKTDPPLFPFLYLSANRLCPQTCFPIPTLRNRLNSIGNQGEFAAYQLHTSGNMKILHAATDGHNLLARDPAGASASLLQQTEAWLSSLGAPVRLQTDRPQGTDIVILRFSFPDISGTYYRPTNVGFGLTYALPVFVAGLCASAGTTYIVENPEAHLHPKGQAMMGTFLARAAACGIQVIVETHSDHVLNGIRVAVKKRDIAPDAVQINFFYQENGVSRIATPRIDADGHIDPWPDDFFDEWDKQLSELL